MNTPLLNLRIQRDKEIFWSHALAKITDKSSLQRFVCSYLSFLGREYDTAILQAIARLQHVPHKNQPPLTASILSLAAQLQRQSTMANQLPLWRQMAELVDYSTPITTVEISLHTRAEVASYYRAATGSYGPCTTSPIGSLMSWRTMISRKIRPFMSSGTLPQN